MQNNPSVMQYRTQTNQHRKGNQGTLGSDPCHCNIRNYTGKYKFMKYKHSFWIFNVAFKKNIYKYLYCLWII